MGNVSAFRFLSVFLRRIECFVENIRCIYHCTSSEDELDPFLGS